MQFDYLILSIAPIPLNNSSIIEGAGIRAWNLADGLSQWNQKVLILYPARESTTIKSISPLIFVKTYLNTDEINVWKHSTRNIIFHGSHYTSLKSIESIDRSQNVIIADMYVPIQIEYAARILDENGSYDRRQDSLFSEMTTNVIEVSDYILCAGNNQKQYYKGIVSSKKEHGANFIFENRILDVPHGFHSSSKTAGRNNDKKKRILFFGAFYPWIENRISIQVIKKLASDPTYEVEVVGTINPFIGKSEKIQKSSLDVTKDLMESGVTIREWVPYNSLSEIYEKKDVVISFNSNIIESELSWRTRFIDAIRFGVPILSNGGDQISNILNSMKAVLIVNETSVDLIVREIREKLHNEELYEKVYSNLIQARNGFSSRSVTKFLSDLPKSKFKSHIIFGDSPKEDKFNNLIFFRFKLAFYLIRTCQIFLLFKLTKRFVSNSFQQCIPIRLISSTKQRLHRNLNRIVLITPQVDFGGAGIVASDLKDEFKKRGISIDIVETHKFRSLLNTFKFVLQKSPLFNLSSNFVILNTVDHSPAVFRFVFSQLRENPSIKLLWYVHEDRPALWINAFSRKWLIRTLNDLQNQILVVTPSKGTLRNLKIFFSGFNGEVETLMYPIPIPSEILNINSRDESYGTLRFYISGATHDSRKNHRIAIEVFSQIKQADIKGLRDFQLVFIGIGDDLYSLETNQLGKKYLGENYVGIPKCSRDQALIFMSECHIALCISEFETLPRFVSEALFLGHPVIRNLCSGLEEQINLNGQINGWLVDQNNKKEFMETILDILNPNVTADEELRKMTKASKLKSEDLLHSFEQGFVAMGRFFKD